MPINSSAEVSGLAPQAVKQSSGPALNLAIDRLIHLEWEQAIPWLRAVDELGNFTAFAELAALPKRGFDTPKDDEMANKLLLEYGRIMPSLSCFKPREFANIFHGKVPTRVVIHKHVYDPKDGAMNSADLIVFGLTGLVVLAMVSYGCYKLHRRHARQKQCFKALQIPCAICGAFRGSPCVDKQGAPVFLHWSRVATSF